MNFITWIMELGLLLGLGIFVCRFVYRVYQILRGPDSVKRRELFVSARRMLVGVVLVLAVIFAILPASEVFDKSRIAQYTVACGLRHFDELLALGVLNAAGEVDVAEEGIERIARKCQNPRVFQMLMVE